MEIKANDYVVIRRVKPCFEDIDVDEFSDAVRAHRNGGYELRGELQIIIGANEAVIAQVLFAPNSSNFD